jgi:hypothetical protein
MFLVRAFVYCRIILIEILKEGLMKSEGVRDIVKWMEQQIKEKKKEMKDYIGWEDMGNKQSELDQMISWKISTEKYMKKLQHQGE